MKTVLIVDDEKNNLLAFTMILRSMGCKVHGANSANQAMRMIGKEDLAELDLVISDYSLGMGKNGLWLLSRIREIFPDAKRVLICGSEPDYLSKEIPYGLLHKFLVKPLVAEDFEKILEDLG